METLNKSILDFSEYEKQKMSFLLFFIFNDLRSLKMAAHPCTAGTSESIRGSLKLSGSPVRERHQRDYDQPYFKCTLDKRNSGTNGYSGARQ